MQQVIEQVKGVYGTIVDFLSKYIPVLGKPAACIEQMGLQWLAFLGLAVILFAIVCLMMRYKYVAILERIVLLGIAPLVLVIPMLLFLVQYLLNLFGVALPFKLIVFNPLNTFFFAGDFSAILLIVMLLVVLWGLFTNRSYLTQGMYGMLIVICLPMGLYNLLFPTVWAPNVTNMIELFTNAEYAIKYMIYAALFFFSLWLIRTGSFKTRITSFWYVFSALPFFLCFSTLLIKATDGISVNGLSIEIAQASNSAAFLKFFSIDNFMALFEAVVADPMVLINNPALLLAPIVDFILVLAFMLLMMPAFGVIATLARKILYRTGDRVFASSSIFGFIFRVIGRSIAVAVCSIIVFMPLVVDLILSFVRPEVAALVESMLGANLVGIVDLVLNIVTSLVYPLPIVGFLFVMLVFEFIAEFIDVKHDIRKARRAEKKEQAEEASVEEIPVEDPTADPNAMYADPNAMYADPNTDYTQYFANDGAAYADPYAAYADPNAAYGYDPNAYADPNAAYADPYAQYGVQQY